MTKKRIAILGAGPSGLAQLRAFQSAQEKGAEIPELVCFEKQSDWGGLWNYTWRTGTDENGEPVHSGMYRYLWSNGPKECLEFADYSFEEHFGKAIPSYPPREVLWDYIKGRVEKAGVRDYIRFSTAVQFVKYLEETSTFLVTVRDYANDKTYTEEFDHVIVATGHFSIPKIPEFEGFKTFNGRILHGHDFRDALEFKDKDVLIVGASYSAEDIGSQCYKYGAKSITSCYRTAPMGYKWPDNWEEKPNMVRTENNTVYFSDGSSKEIDAIILCTGYLHHFPFLEEPLRLSTDNRLWPMKLYKGVAWEDNPKLFYLGMQDQWYTFNMFDAQAWWVRDAILGLQTIPSKEEIQAYNSSWQEAEGKLETAEEMYTYQGNYIEELIAETDYPSFDVKGCNDTFLEWKKDKKESIMGYRNYSYRSLMTGTMSPPHHTPWLEALDDSLETYLATKESD